MATVTLSPLWLAATITVSAYGQATSTGNAFRPAPSPSSGAKVNPQNPGQQSSPSQPNQVVPGSAQVGTNQSGFVTNQILSPTGNASTTLPQGPAPAAVQPALPATAAGVANFPATLSQDRAI